MEGEIESLTGWLQGPACKLSRHYFESRKYMCVCLNSRLLIYLKVQWSLQNAAIDLLRLLYSPSSNLNSHRYNTSMP